MPPENSVQADRAALPLILLVDDAQDQRETLKTILAGIDCRLSEAASGAEALEFVLREKPDLTLMDVVMPDMNGFEVLRRLKQDPDNQDLAVIFLTAMMESEDIVAGFGLGAVDYIGKPFQPAELRARVKMNLEFKWARNHEKKLIEELHAALAEVRQLSGLIPICSHCKKIRNDQGFWLQVEDYISRHSEAMFTHGLCPECVPLFFPEMAGTLTSMEGPSILPLTTREGASGTEPLPKILVVDDTPADIQNLLQLLRQDHKVFVALNGPAALDIANREKPDLILLDVVMPDMDGHEVCRRLKEDPISRQIPVIFISGANEEVDEVAGFEVGAVDYITKPFSLPVVQARIRNYLDLKRYRDARTHLNTLDEQTGILNRKAFLDFLDFMWNQATRHQTPVSIILAEVDFFELYAEHSGLQAGWASLRHVAAGLMEAKRRTTDLVARYDGATFVCVLPATSQDGAVTLAELMRKAIEALAVPHARSAVADHLTVSLGVSTRVPQMGETPASLIEDATRALQRAIKNGRNRVAR